MRERTTLSSISINQMNQRDHSNAYDALYDEPIETTNKSLQREVKRTKSKSTLGRKVNRLQSKENTVKGKRPAKLSAIDGQLHALKKKKKVGSKSNKEKTLHKTKKPVNDVTINLRHKKLDTFPSEEDQEDWGQARIIDLSFNTFKSLHFRDDVALVNCKSLKLAGNHLDSIEGAFEETHLFGTILQLLLGSNNLSNIGEHDLKAFKSLKTLAIESNQLESIHPKAFETMSQLKSLNIAYNDLSTLPDDLFKNNRRITEIFLENNKLNCVPWKAMESLKNLDELALSRNDLAKEKSFYKTNTIPPLILQSLRILRLNECGLTKFDPVASFAKLRELHLDNNHLSAIPSSLVDHVPQLSVLNIRNNDISKLSGLKHLSLLSELAILQVSGNPLCRDENYTSQIQSLIPHLMSIDGVDFTTPSMKLEEDHPVDALLQDASNTPIENHLAELQKSPVVIFGHKVRQPTLSTETQVAFSEEQRRKEIELMKNLDFSLSLEDLEKQYNAALQQHVLPQPATDAVLQQKRTTKIRQPFNNVEMLSRNETSRMYDDCMRAQETVENQLAELTTFVDTPYDQLDPSQFSSAREPTIRPTSSARQSRPTSAASTTSSGGKLASKLGDALTYSDTFHAPTNTSHKTLYDENFKESSSLLSSEEIMAKLEQSNVISLNDLPDSLPEEASEPSMHDHSPPKGLSQEIRSSETVSPDPVEKNLPRPKAKVRTTTTSTRVSQGGMRFRIPKRRLKETQQEEK